ncbi:hypothetical protein K505DRAFT_370787 [Melanomma pulvis-pyrius CBS 109.77]|uniref:Uncharacterized protein n=1 Tax=Melanomma pulvis-pyrius CBS 109.77 TaxID=1314802 RepID=A0A6A6XT41_9PLEO|nr:hypothetical protein K505DRAFT_370787 [Melanomma pulvis-pyrius CBS 109.77]
MSLLQSSKRAEDKFIGSCPSGGEWYACGEGSKSNFVGCCATDPCSTGCSQGNIKPTSFDVGLNITYPDASCGTASDFYTCNSGTKTFWGCCKSNPCQQEQTCPTGDLVPAFMERKEQFIAYAGVSNTTSPSATTTGAANASPTGKPASTHTVAIIAGAVAGGLGIAAIIAVLIFFLCRRKNRKNKENSFESGPSETTPMTEKHDYRASTHTEAPPLYTSPNPNSYPPSPSFRPHYEAHSQDIQELPAEVISGTTKSSKPSRFSELPANLSPANSSNPNRASELPANLPPTNQRSPNLNNLSELPAEGPWMAELETPTPSPRPQQSAFVSESEQAVSGPKDARENADHGGSKPL